MRERRASRRSADRAAGVSRARHSSHATRAHQTRQAGLDFSPGSASAMAANSQARAYHQARKAESTGRKAPLMVLKCWNTATEVTPREAFEGLISPRDAADQEDALVRSFSRQTKVRRARVASPSIRSTSGASRPARTESFRCRRIAAARGTIRGLSGLPIAPAEARDSQRGQRVVRPLCG